MTQADTSLGSCFHKMIPDDTKGQQSESKSGSQDAIAFLSLIDGLTRVEREGASLALKQIEQLVSEAQNAQRNANFHRRKEICSGMVKAFNVAHAAILGQFNLEEGN